MSAFIFVLSDQNGDFVRHMSFQEKKLFAALCLYSDASILMKSMWTVPVYLKKKKRTIAGFEPGLAGTYTI